MESYFTSKAVVFLEMGDFNPDLTFKYKLTKPMLLMIGGSFCPHCTHAAPDFNKFALSSKDKMTCAVLQIDGSKKEQELGKLISDNIKFRGVPAFLIFNVKGEFVKIHPDRSIESFENITV